MGATRVQRAIAGAVLAVVAGGAVGCGSGAEVVVAPADEGMAPTGWTEVPEPVPATGAPIESTASAPSLVQPLDGLTDAHRQVLADEAAGGGDADGAPRHQPARAVAGPADALIAASEARFGDDHAGVAVATDGSHGLVLVLRGAPEALPSSFRGVPVLAARYSAAELEAASAAIQVDGFESLPPAGVDLSWTGVTPGENAVSFGVVHPEPDALATIVAVLGPGPWRVVPEEGHAQTAPGRPVLGSEPG
jgi:hypothetical protein